MAKTNPPPVSIIIPVFQEEQLIHETLDTLLALPGISAAEVILVDGDPEGSTLSCTVDYSVQRVLAPAGRGPQMNAGAGLARGTVLLFLHADTRLPKNAIKAIQAACRSRSAFAGAFDLGIGASGTAFRVIEQMVYWRTRITRIPYGDQAIFVRRAVFNRLGGYRPIPIMEDIDLMQRIKKSGGKITIISEKVVTSARRWEKEGLMRATLRNWILAGAYYAGVDPGKLKRYYR